MLNLIRCEFWKLKRKMFVQLQGAGVFYLLYGKRKTAEVSSDTTAAKDRSDGIRTHGLLVPNQARYQLRYTP